MGCLLHTLELADISASCHTLSSAGHGAQDCAQVRGGPAVPGGGGVRLVPGVAPPAAALPAAQHIFFHLLWQGRAKGSDQIFPSSLGGDGPPRQPKLDGHTISCGHLREYQKHMMRNWSIWCILLPLHTFDANTLLFVNAPLFICL